MAETELASIGYPCGNISLNIPGIDYRKYFENPKPNKGAIAYWDDGEAPDDGDGPPPDPSDSIVWVYAAVDVSYQFDGEARVSGGETETPVPAPVTVLVEPDDYNGADIVRIVCGDGSRITMWGPRSNSFPEATPITGVSTSLKLTRADNGLPYEPPPSGGGSGEPPQPFLVVRKINEDGSETEIGREESIESKPEFCWISCEECLENCVQVVKNPGDSYENSLCVCKEQETPEDESMKARIKAELLVEIPPIVIARFKATEEKRFVDHVVGEAGKIIKPELKDIVIGVLNETDSEGVSELERVVLNALNVEIDLLPNVYASLKTKLETEFFSLISLLNSLDNPESGDLKTDFFSKTTQYLDTEKYTFKSLIAQLDENAIQELRTKMKIPLNPDDPKNPSNNDLNVNGITWKVVKNGEAVDKVTRAIQTMDNIESLLNSGSAIQAALKVKYGKNYSIQSSEQTGGSIIFEVSEV